MSMRSIIDAAETLLTTWIAESSSDLKDIGNNLHKGGGIPPLARFPCIVLGADTESREHRRAAGTVSVAFGEKYKWFIAIVHMTGDLAESFEKVCDIWEELKIKVDDNYTWSSTCDDTNYDGDIVYGSPEFGDESKLTYAILVSLVSNVRWGGA